MNDGELLQRIAQILRQDIGPAVDAEYPKTQAFMAAVVLQKLGRQLELARAHATANAEDMATLIDDLRGHVDDAPAPIRSAIEALAQTPDDAALCRLIDGLYAARAELGDSRFTALLGRIRQTLRRSVDRRIVVAG